MKEYETSKIAMDPVIFTIHNGELMVLLHKREKEPYLGRNELPGGLLLPDETAEESLSRKLKQLVGHENIFFRQFHTFTSPNRDPRIRTVSIGFVSLVNDSKIKEFVSWHNYDSIEGLAFDHNKILQEARRYLKNNIDPIIVKHFMPELFAINKLQEVATECQQLLI